MMADSTLPVGGYAFMCVCVCVRHRGFLSLKFLCDNYDAILLL